MIEWFLMFLIGFGKVLLTGYPMLVMGLLLAWIACIPRVVEFFKDEDYRCQVIFAAIYTTVVWPMIWMSRDEQTANLLYQTTGLIGFIVIVGFVGVAIWIMIKRLKDYVEYKRG